MKTAYAVFRSVFLHRHQLIGGWCEYCRNETFFCLDHMYEDFGKPHKM
jgi:hypothetical protein